MVQRIDQECKKGPSVDDLYSLLTATIATSGKISVEVLSRNTLLPQEKIERLLNDLVRRDLIAVLN